MVNSYMRVSREDSAPTGTVRTAVVLRWELGGEGARRAAPAAPPPAKAKPKNYHNYHIVYLIANLMVKISESVRLTLQL